MKAVRVEKAGRHDEKGALAVEAVKALQGFVSHEETRYAVTFIGVDEENAVATDGHKLLKVPRAVISENLEPGLYRVAKEGKALVLMPCQDETPPQFPNYAQVIPAPAHKAAWYFEAGLAGSNVIHHAGTFLGGVLYHLSRQKIHMNADIVAAVPEGRWAFSGKGPLSPVRVDGMGEKEGWTAVIMPMRGDSGEPDYRPPQAPEEEAPAPQEAPEKAPEAPQDVPQAPPVVEEAPAPAPVAVGVGVAGVPAWLAAIKRGRP